jgi:tRNA A-37 threonylcarbamoyl transferase component Bud32
VDSEAGGDSSNALALPVDGTIHHVIPIQGSLRDHSFKIPAAYDPPRLYLTVPGRPPLPVRFREGELDSLIEKLPVEPLDWPARPVPAWAWAFGGGALVALAGLAWQRKRPTPSPRVERDTPATVAADVEEVRPFPRLEGTRLRSDGGEDFMVVRPVGKGGMGAVYEAVSLTRTDDPHWAIKVVHADIAASEEYRERFRREVTVCATLDHPGVVKVLDWGLYRANDADWPFMVMELVRGRDLRAILSAGRISDRQAVEWTIEALQALHVVHRRGIIHRDLKPENIMITKSGHVKLMDFGVARQSAPSTLTGTDTAIGTPMYMSPEHLNAKTVTPASDIYSMGIVLFELLSGRVPFEGDEMMIVIVKKLHGESLPLAALRPDLPGRLIEVVERMIARDPADRHPDCRSVIQALDQAGGR